MPTLKDYIVEFSLAIKFQDGDKLKPLIQISSPEISNRANFPIPTQQDLLLISDSKWQDTIQLYLKLAKIIIFKQDMNEAFSVINDLVISLNRIAENEDNWIIKPLINASTELINLYKAKVKYMPPEPLVSEENDGKTTNLERLAGTINRSFKICLNDKNLDVRYSKKTAIFFFVGELLRVYFRLGKLELAKSIEKALRVSKSKLPDYSEVEKPHAINYLYYSGILAVGDGEFNIAEEKLSTAISLCKLSYKRQLESILIVLIPVKFLTRRIMPSAKCFQLYPNINFLYAELFKSIKQGNLKLFDLISTKFEMVFLKKHLYLVIEQLRPFVVLTLFKKTFWALDNRSHIPVSALQIALEFSTNHKKNYTLAYSTSETIMCYSLDSVECLLANLIFENKIKGYISHTNRVVVLSKKDPFPNLVVRN